MSACISKPIANIERKVRGKFIGAIAAGVAESAKDGTFVGNTGTFDAHRVPDRRE